MRKSTNGFTIVELIIIIVTIGVLAALGIISYGEWGRRTSKTSVRSDLMRAAAELESNMNAKNNYPPNLAGIDFVASNDVVVVLYTNAPTNGVYESLTTDQNAQLLLNVCNANLNGLYNTVCAFSGNGGGAKIHVKGTNSTNVQWGNPIAQETVSLPYGPEYEAATDAIIDQFLAQGGTFPVNVSGKAAPLPEPTLVPMGLATDFCLEGHSSTYPDVIFHLSPKAIGASEGACPDNPSLHYFP